MTVFTAPSRSPCRSSACQRGSRGPSTIGTPGFAHVTDNPTPPDSPGITPERLIETAAPERPTHTTPMRRHLLAVLLLLAAPLSHATAQAPAATARLAAVVSDAAGVKIATRSAREYAAASTAYRTLLTRLRAIGRDSLRRDDQVDYDLLDAHLRTRAFEIDSLRLHQVVPVTYLALSATDALFLRPGAISDSGVKTALAELRQFPAVLSNARANLTVPARTWTENAIAQTRYVRILLDEYVPQAVVDDPTLKRDLVAAANTAARATEEFRVWMERELLPRSTRAPTWKPGEIDFYQLQFEQLDGYGVDVMLRIAEREAAQLTSEMQALAKQIHPSGDLRTVWEQMKDEAPPWEGVIPMAQRYVDMTTAWLRGPGAHVATIPDFDYGAVLTTPMARRTLSFGGAQYGPTVAGRLSGYYVLTPLEPWLSAAEKASRIRSYNPYWTHVISYHEWLGHTAQRASAAQNVTRPMRRLFQSGYFSQSWSFYLERLLEDEGYYEGLPYMERLKTKMARRQMRMWRVQRILTKLKMAKGEMSFDEAVNAYITHIGMEPTNAVLEVQRDSQNATPPGREIIGELVILQLRDEYKRRMGVHYSLKRFNDQLLTYGDLPFRQIRRLMLE
jgi:uncharacterized protein (DUF885 family)